MSWIAWIILAVVLAICEIATPSVFFLLCLSIGALFASLAAYFDVSNWLEFGVFIVISILSIYTIRPIFKRMLKKSETVNSNVDELIGLEAKVTGRITPEKSGFVKVRSEIWLAQSDNNNIIEEGEIVKVKAISGTKLIVKK